jgi:hypothetical protein
MFLVKVYRYLSGREGELKPLAGLMRLSTAPLRRVVPAPHHSCLKTKQLSFQQDFPL